MSAAKNPKPAKAGPIEGAPPSLEWVAIDRLHVDGEYQRSVEGSKSRAIIYGMVKCWNWSLCQPLVVSRRADGSLFILDGQHRHSGALERGDIPHLPCVILPGLAVAAEAETFVALNTRRQRLEQSDIFKGMLAAGDTDAAAIAAMMRETGWRLARTKNSAAWKPGDLQCAPMLVKVVRAFGQAPVRNALTALREAYPNRAVTNSSTLLKALILVYRGTGLEGGDPDAFIEALGEVDPADWDDFGREQRRQSPTLSRIEAIAEAMLDAYREWIAA